jgi:hypothetical protein
MRYLLFGAVLLLGAVLVLSTAAPVRADAGLADAVAAAYFPRTADEGLHAIAHQRAAEISSCECLDHGGRRSGTAEVLGWNVRVASPIGHVVEQWIDSAGHNAILSDRSLGRIGCAEGIVDGVHWFACVLAAGPLPAQAAPVMMLPDTALPNRTRELTAPTLRFVPT